MAQGRRFSRRNALRQGLAIGASVLTWSAGGVNVEGQESEAVRKLEQARIDVITKARKSVIGVYAKGSTGGGSGVLIAPDGYALTNYHVYRPVGDFLKCSMNDGKFYDAIIVGLDPTGDIALIKLLGRTDFPVAALADSDKVRVGDSCFAVGDPFTLATNFQHTVTSGIVSGVHRQQPKYQGEALLEYCDAIQTDASINPGNSGGPLFNERGEVIGINGLIYSEKRRGVNAGVGYAISANQIKNFLGILRGGRIVDHASLGAVATTNSDGEAEITNLTANAEVSRRGLDSGDIIEKLNGREVQSANDLKNAVFILPKGWRVPLEYSRKGESQSMTVRLLGMHRDGELEDIVEKESTSRENASGRRELPKEYQKVFKKKRGFANYYFNELERDRLLAAMAKRMQVTPPAMNWRIEGQSATGKFVAELGDKTSSLELAGKKFTFDAEAAVSQQLVPRDSGGLLPTLHLWRRLYVAAPGKYGAIDYWGAAPWPNAPALCDVLTAISKDEELRAFVDPASGDVLGLELWISPDDDPCEVAFSYNNANTPSKLVAIQAGRVFADIQVTDFKQVAAP